MRSEAELTAAIAEVDKQIEKLKQKRYHLIRCKGMATSERLGVEMQEKAAVEKPAPKPAVKPTHEENLSFLAGLVTGGGDKSEEKDGA